MRRQRQRPLGNGRAPALTIKQILAWADSHYQRTGRWPQQLTGAIPDSLGERWVNIDNALRQGLRGLPGGSSLALLLRDKRGAAYRFGRLFHEADILRWADRHIKRTGRWPTQYSGPIVDAPGETWQRVQLCLLRGGRGLTGGSSLAKLLA